MIYATLPRNIELNGIQHSLHFHSGLCAVYQNVDNRPGGPLIGDSPNEPMPEQGPHNAGQKCMFHVYRLINHNPGEELGELIASYTNLNAAIIRASKEQ